MCAAATPRLPDRASIERMFPRGKGPWITALVEAVPGLMRKHGVTNAERWRKLMAQIDAETDGLALKSMRENMNYRSARIQQVFSYRLGIASKKNPRFRGWSKSRIADVLASDPDLLAETVYGGRKELGNVHPGDGAKFIGRGPLQTTGREWYEKIGRSIGVDLIANPGLLEKPRHGIAGTFAEWQMLGCNELSDRADITVVSKRVNGGTNGLSHRKAAYRRACSIWPDDWVLPVETDEPPLIEIPQTPEPDEEPVTPRHSQDVPIPPQAPPPGPVTPTRTAARSRSVWAAIATFLLAVVQTFVDWLTWMFDGIASMFGLLPGMAGYVTDTMAPLATLGPAVGLDLKKVTALVAGALIATFLVRHVRDKMELERRRKEDGGEAERNAA